MPWGGDKVGIGQRVDSMVLEGSSHLKDYVIPQGISLPSSTSATEVMSTNSQQPGLENGVRKAK